MLEKLQAKASFISARWWVKFSITEFAQTKNGKHNKQGTDSESVVIYSVQPVSLGFCPRCLIATEI